MQEDIRDLLSADAGAPTGSPGVHIREAVGGGVQLAGAQEREVASQAEMAAVLEQARPLQHPFNASASHAAACTVQSHAPVQLAKQFTLALVQATAMLHQLS